MNSRNGHKTHLFLRVLSCRVLAVSLLVFASGVWAAPEVTLRALSGATINSITLSGQIRQAPESLEAWFEYGLEPPYQRSNSTLLSSAVLPTAINHYVSGLKCGETYQYRMRVRTQGSVLDTVLSSFSTDACSGNTISVEWVSTEMATDISSESVRLQSVVDPGGLPTHYYFEYGNSTQFGTSTPVLNIGDGTIPVSRSWLVSGLTCDSLYFYRVVAVRDDGTDSGIREEGQTVSFTTEACPLGIKQINIDWIGMAWATVSVVLDSQGEESDVEIYYGKITDERLGLQTDIQKITTGQAVFRLDGLICGTQYRMRVALRRGILETISEVENFSTVDCNIAPVVETLPPASIQMDNALFRARVTSNSADTEIYFEYQSAGGILRQSPRFVQAASAFERIVSLNVTGLDCEVSYSVKVRADGSHGQDEGETMQFTTSSCQGGNPDSLTGINLSAGGGHSLVTNAGGGVFAWGDHERGQLGSHDVQAILTTGLRWRDNLPLTGVIDVSAGVHHSLALMDDGRVLAWGDNTQGQLGDGTNVSRTSPEFVVDINQTPVNNVVAIAAGEYHSLALLGTGQVLSWGANDYGQLGNNSLQMSVFPVKVLTVENASDIAAGYRSSYARLANGQLLAWGENTYGQLGVASSLTTFMLPEYVNMPATVSSFAAGQKHVVAIDTTNNVYVWGDNSVGQLAVISEVGVPSPHNITDQFPQDVYLKAIAGAGFSGVLRSSGEVLLWGDNAHGQIGQNSVEPRFNEPVAVKNLFGQNTLKNIVDIDAGDYHSLALTSDGDLVVWGDNTRGQLGISASQSMSPLVFQHKGVPFNIAGLYMLLSSKEINLEEGKSASLSIWLSKKPEGIVRIKAEVELADTGLTLKQTDLRFSEVNWNIPQTLELTMALDKNSTNGSARVILNAAGLPSSTIIIHERDMQAPRVERKRIAAFNVFSIVFFLLFILVYRKIKSECDVKISSRNALQFKLS